jgi:hypothetical protein
MVKVQNFDVRCSLFEHSIFNKKAPIILRQAQDYEANKYGSYLLSRIVVQYHRPYME